jgi:hypothetical protein
LSIPERIYRISKAYLGQVRSRIDAELSEAERELDGGKDPAMPDREDTSPDAMMQRAQARIDAARRDLEARQQTGGDAASVTLPPATSNTPSASTTASTVPTTETSDPNASDFRVLGVPVGSDFAVVQSAYEKLARRCDPRRFPDGSTEQKEAERILEKVNASYELLKKRLDPMQTRFSNLEFE